MLLPTSSSPRSQVEVGPCRDAQAAWSYACPFPLQRPCCPYCCFRILRPAVGKEMAWWQTQRQLPLYQTDWSSQAPTGKTALPAEPGLAWVQCFQRWRPLKPCTGKMLWSPVVKKGAPSLPWITAMFWGHNCTLSACRAEVWCQGVTWPGLCQIVINQSLLCILEPLWEHGGAFSSRQQLWGLDAAATVAAGRSPASAASPACPLRLAVCIHPAVGSLGST